MTHELQATAFRTTIGNNRVPINVPCCPGIDEQMIAEQEAKIAIAKRQVAKRRRNSPKKTGKQAGEKKQGQQERELSCFPDICSCFDSKQQHCCCLTTNAPNED